MGAHPPPRKPQERTSHPCRSPTVAGKDVYLPRHRPPPSKGAQYRSSRPQEPLGSMPWRPPTQTTRTRTREATCANHSELLLRSKQSTHSVKALNGHSCRPSASYGHGPSRSSKDSGTVSQVVIPILPSFLCSPHNYKRRSLDTHRKGGQSKIHPHTQTRRITSHTRKHDSSPRTTGTWAPKSSPD